jgi:hypothetical protein
MAKTRDRKQTRRSFLSAAGKAAAAASVATGFPAIVPSSVFGSTSPGNRMKLYVTETGSDAVRQLINEATVVATSVSFL